MKIDNGYNRYMFKVKIGQQFIMVMVSILYMLNSIICIAYIFETIVHKQNSL